MMEFIKNYAWILAMTAGANFLDLKNNIWHRFLYYSFLIALVAWKCV